MADGAAPRATRVIAPRATRVLRAGPAPRGRLGDILVGIVGLLLLISTAYFAVALPKVETPPVIYQVTFATSAGPIAGESHDFDSTTDAGRRYSFEFEVPADNLLDITLAYSFADDLAASKPDQFRLEVYDNEGNPLGQRTIINAQPTAGATPGSYDAVPAKGNLTWNAGTLPDDFTVDDPDGVMTLESVLADANKREHTDDKGMWRVQVTFNVGNCPTPQEAGGDPAALQRATACAGAAQSPDPRAAPQDRGNPFTIEAFTYRTFEPHVERIQ